MREARVLGLFNQKNNKISPETILELINQLSLLPIEYNGNISDLILKLDILTKKYPNYFNMINFYFKDTKIKYFQDDNFNFNYNKFPKRYKVKFYIRKI